MNLSNKVEREVALLFAARKLIHGMVNHSMLAFGEDWSSQTVVPQHEECGELFNILLVDLISPLGPPFTSSQTLLSALASICESPCFDVDDSVGDLKMAVQELDHWLEQSPTFDGIWLPSIDREMTLVMPRREFIYICANMAKHNTFRLSVVAKKVLAILQRSDPSMTLKDAFLAFQDFYEWFHWNVFRYHLSKLSEMLNNITWAIQKYLLPEYARSYEIEPQKSEAMHAVIYIFNYPVDVISHEARVFYWDLMNEIRASPPVKRFRVSKYLAMDY